MPTKTRQEIDADVDALLKGGAPDAPITKYLQLYHYDPNNMDAEPVQEASEKEKTDADIILATYRAEQGDKEFAEKLKATGKAVLGRMLPTEEQQKEMDESWMPQGIAYVAQDPGRMDPVFQIGLPVVAQALAERTPLGWTGRGLVGAAASGTGEAIVETRKALMGESQGWRSAAANIAAATVGGFQPGGAFAKTAGKATEPVISGAKAVLAESLINGISGAASELTREAINKGEWADPKQVMAGSLIPAGSTMLALPLGVIGRRASERSQELEQRIASIRESGGYTTPGQAIPSEFAGTEMRMAMRDPRLSAAEVYDKSMNSLREKLEARTQGRQAPIEILEQMSDLFNKPSTYKKQIETLQDAGIKARNNLDEAENKLLVAWKAGDLAEVERLSQVRQIFSDEKLMVDFQEAIEHAKRTHAAELTQGVTHLTPVQAMDEGSKAVSRTREALVGKGGYFTSKYADIPINQTGWAAHPIIALANQKMGEITAGMDDRLVALVKGSLEALESTDGVSYQNLRDLDTRISDIYRMRPEMKGTSSFKAARELQQKIRAEMDEQAEFVLGKEKGTELKELNKQYHTYKDLEDSPGIEVLLDPKPTGEHMGKLIADLKANGDASKYYSNVMDYIKYMESLNPEAGQLHLDQFQRAIRGAVMNEAREGSDSLGHAFIEPKKLFDTMSAIESAAPGSLKRMGFMHPESIEKLKAVVEKYPKASKMTADNWDSVMRSDAFQNASPDLIPILESALSDSQTRNLITKSALLGGVEKSAAAAKAYEEAAMTAQRVGVDLKKVEALYQKAIQDPVLRNLDKGIVDETNMGKLMQLIMYTPGIDKDFTEEFAKRLKAKNPELLNQIRLYAEADLLQRGYEAQAPSFSSMIKDVDVQAVAELSRHNRSKRMEEVWERIDPFFEPEQKKGIQDLADEAFDKLLYARRAQIGAPEFAKQIPGAVGTAASLVRTIGNAIDNQRYKWAALNIQHGSGLFDYSHRLKGTAALLRPAESVPQAVSAGFRAPQINLDQGDEDVQPVLPLESAPVAIQNVPGAAGAKKKEAGPSRDRLRQAVTPQAGAAQ